MKFKVGQKVRVKNVIEDNTLYPSFGGIMYSFLGKTSKIVKIYHYGEIELELSNRYFWNEEWLCPLRKDKLDRILK